MSFFKKNICAIFLVFHALAWTLIPTLFQHTAPLDTIEGLVWGHAWQWGYYKHPPLQAWLLESTTYIFGNSGLGFFGLSAALTTLGLWAVYRTARLYLNRAQSLGAMLVTSTILYFNFLSPEFNPNVLLLGLWALAGHCFAKALHNNKPSHWLILGITLALGFYAKYTTALLVVSFGLYLLVKKRDALRQPWPYLAALLCFALCLPHLAWLYAHDFMPLTYASSRSEEAKNIAEHFYFPLKFLLSQSAVMIPAFIVLALYFLPLQKRATETKDALPFWLAFGPLILSLLLALFSGHRLRDMWGMPYLSFIPMWFFYQLNHTVAEKNLRRFTAGFVILYILALAAYPINIAVAPRPLRAHFPGAALSQKIHAAWHKQTDKPLSTIISNAWLGGNIAFYGPDVRHRPQVWIDGDTSISPWIDPAIAKKNGAVAIWDAKATPPAMPENVIKQPVLTLALLPPRQDESITLQWAIIPPQSE